MSNSSGFYLGFKFEVEYFLGKYRAEASCKGYDRLYVKSNQGLLDAEAKIKQLIDNVKAPNESSREKVNLFEGKPQLSSNKVCEHDIKHELGNHKRLEVSQSNQKKDLSTKLKSSSQDELSYSKKYEYASKGDLEF
jgi:hypothetical protein